jgi:LysR substrate binding domain
VTGTTGALLEQVSRYAIEAAFVAERFEPAGLEIMPVFREKLVVIAPKEITAIKNAGDIRGMTVIAFAAGCSCRRTLEEWLARSKVTPLSVSWNLGLITRSSPASPRVLELLWYPIRSLTRCTRSATSAFCRHRLSLQMPRRFLSGPENIVLLLSTLYVANWLRRTSANTSRRFVRSVQRLQPGLDLGARRLHKRREREPSSKEVQSFVSGKSGSIG